MLYGGPTGGVHIYQEFQEDCGGIGLHYNPFGEFCCEGSEGNFWIASKPNTCEMALPNGTYYCENAPVYYSTFKNECYMN